MATPKEHEEIVKGIRVMINGFICKGILPCSEIDIMNDRLPPEKNSLFLSFGIDLKLAITCYPMDPVIPLVKLEPGVLNDQIFQQINEDLSYGQIQIKVEEAAKDDFQILFDVKTEVNEDIYESDAEYEPLAKKSKRKVNKKASKINKTKPNLQDVDNSIDENKLPSDGEFDFMNELNEEFSETDEEYKPSIKKPKRKYTKRSKDEPKEPKVAKPRGRFKGYLKCSKCSESLPNKEAYRNHRDDHYFSEIRLLNDVSSSIDYAQFLSIEEFRKKEAKMKNHIQFQTPPPDFTREDFENCHFPKPIDEYVLTDYSTRMKQDPNFPNRLQCTACHQVVKDLEDCKEHQRRLHKLLFKCPFENCNFNKQPRLTTMLRFARHFFYHERPFLQLSYPHFCIACDYSSPSVSLAERHFETKGPFHDNKCPRCDQRFYSRIERVKHMDSMNHHGVVCGFCGEVFDDENKLSAHSIHFCTKKPRKETICDECGKSYVEIDFHKSTMHGEKDPQKCPEPNCDFILNNKAHLKSHMKKHRKPIVPCQECGRCVRSGDFKHHTLQFHTPEHLKPFVCQICKKGFIYKSKFEDHMNVHLGLKPHKCQYCNSTFADKANKRMHERCSHEGFKRSK